MEEEARRILRDALTRAGTTQEPMGQGLLTRFAPANRAFRERVDPLVMARLNRLARDPLKRRRDMLQAEAVQMLLEQHLHRFKCPMGR